MTMLAPLAEIWMPSPPDLRLFGAELSLVAAIVALLVLSMLFGRSERLGAGVALAAAVAVIFFCRDTAGLVDTAARTGLTPPGAAPMLIADRFTVFFKLLLALFLATIVWLWMTGTAACRPERGGARPVPAGPEFFVLLLTSMLGMSLMLATPNLLVMMIAVETASLPSYVLAASDRRSRAGAEAALKYVLFGATTAAVMAYGLSLLFGLFGSLDLTAIAAAASGGMPALGWIAMAAFLTGVAFKISAVPLHFWCPDVFEGAPVEVATWLSVASKAAGLGLLLRIVAAFGGGVPDTIALPLAWGIGLVAAVTCTLGNLAALRQDSVKRMLAYSSIAHAGYMMMAAALPPGEAGHGGIRPAMAAIVSYLFVYLLMNLGAFGVTAMVAWSQGSDRLAAFTGLGRRAPWLAVPMSVCLFSLVGLPPLAGFAAKWWLLAALGQGTERYPWLWWLVLVAVINTAISLYYYVRVIRQMFLADDARLERPAVPVGGLALANGCAVLLLLLGTVAFGLMRDRSQAYAACLAAGPPADVLPAGDPLARGVSPAGDRGIEAQRP